MAKKVVRIKGEAELHKAFSNMREAARGRALLTAAKAGILPIQNEAIQNAPYKTGTYRRSLHTEEVEVTNHSALVATGTDVEYARRLEFGYNDTDSAGRSYHQPAQPHIRPAYDNKRAEAIQEVGDALAEIVLAAI